MAGAIVLVVVLLLFPVLVGLVGAVLAAVIGEALARDGELRHAGSEDLNL